MDAFSKRITQLRKKQNLTQKDVAKALQVPLSTYKEWEYGRRIQGEHIYVALAETLGVSVRALLTGEQEPQNLEPLESINMAIANLEKAKKALLSLL